VVFLLRHVDALQFSEVACAANARLELRGFMYFDKAAVSFSLLLDALSINFPPMTNFYNANNKLNIGN
jgi:hypothetical protein